MTSRDRFVLVRGRAAPAFRHKRFSAIGFELRPEHGALDA